MGVIYKPPDQCITEFNEHISILLNSITRENKICYLLGDFNINLFNVSSHLQTADFINCMYTYSCHPVITGPFGPVSDHSTTLIDNIFTNHLVDLNIHSGIFFTDITDHFPIFFIDSNVDVQM